MKLNARILHIEGQLPGPLPTARPVGRARVRVRQSFKMVKITF